MRLLLDGHAFLWWVLDDPRLSAAARRILSDGANALYLSAATAWEVIIKTQIGRLRLPEVASRYVRSRMSQYGIESLPIQLSHVLQIETLPLHHRDPFDRILIAQSQLEDLPILTADRQIAQYDVKVVW